MKRLIMVASLLAVLFLTPVAAFAEYGPWGIFGYSYGYPYYGYPYGYYDHYGSGAGISIYFGTNGYDRDYYDRYHDRWSGYDRDRHEYVGRDRDYDRDGGEYFGWTGGIDRD